MDALLCLEELSVDAVLVVLEEPLPLPLHCVSHSLLLLLRISMHPTF